jgi:hypothetical protein
MLACHAATQDCAVVVADAKFSTPANLVLTSLLPEKKLAILKSAQQRLFDQFDTGDNTSDHLSQLTNAILYR